MTIKIIKKVMSGLFACMVSASAHAVVIDFDTPTTNITYNGSATQVSDYGRLTSANNSQVGSMWYNTAFDTSEFTVTFDLYAGSNTGGADGLTFAIINTSMGLNAIGGAGGNLGYLGMSGQSVAWEFDTWYNGGGDPNGNHVGIDANGVELAAQSLDSFSIILEDGLIHKMEVNYSDTSGVLSVLIDNTVLVSAGMGSYMPDTAYFGFTGATGGANNLQYVDNWTIVATAAVPEPATLALMGLGLASFGYKRRKVA